MDDPLGKFRVSKKGVVGKNGFRSQTRPCKIIPLWYFGMDRISTTIKLRIFSSTNPDQPRNFANIHGLTNPKFLSFFNHISTLTLTQSFNSQYWKKLQCWFFDP